jgi:hypothetical protein
MRNYGVMGEGCIMLAGGEVSCRLLSAIPFKARGGVFAVVMEVWC